MGMVYDEVLDLTEFDLDSLLETLTLDFITENINGQIEGSIPLGTNFLEMVINKFNYIIENDEIELETKQQLKYYIMDFCDDLIESIAQKFDFIVNLVDDTYTAHIDLLYTLYTFFISNKYDNIMNFLIHYINKNRDILLKNIGADSNSAKDFTSLCSIKKNINKHNIPILSNLSTILDFIRNNAEAIDSDEFLSYLDDGDTNIYNIKYYYEQETMLGNFVPSILVDILSLSYDDDIMIRMRNDLRITFYFNEEDINLCQI